MKILVDKELVEDALSRMIWIANQGSPRKPGDGSDFDRVITILQNFLDADAVDENTEDSINQQVSDSAYDFTNEPSCLVTKVEDGQVTVTGKNIDTRATWTTVQGNTPYDITDDDKRWADKVIEENIQIIKESFTKNSCKITVSSIPETQKLIDLELINHRAILELIEIMWNSTCNRGWNRDTEMRTQLKEIKSKMRGVKYEI